MVQVVAHAVAQGRAHRVAQVAACLLAQRGARWGASKMRAQVMARVRDQVMTQVMAQVKAQEAVQVRAREGGPQPGAGATCRALQAAPAGGQGNLQGPAGSRGERVASGGAPSTWHLCASSRRE